MKHKPEFYYLKKNKEIKAGEKNVSTSDSANMFSSELEKWKNNFRPISSQLKLTGEYVDLVAGMQHLIPFLLL